MSVRREEARQAGGLARLNELADGDEPVLPGAELGDDAVEAVMVILRLMEGGAPLPQRQPGSTGAQPAVRL